VQTYEDLGLCRYGGGAFIDAGHPRFGKLPVNPSGGLRMRTSRRRHRVDAAVCMFWQLQRTIKKHFGNSTLQIGRQSAD
jgi:acetyl-CoA C-acetyltransferase